MLDCCHVFFCLQNIFLLEVLAQWLADCGFCKVEATCFPEENGGHSAVYVLDIACDLVEVWYDMMVCNGLSGFHAMISSQTPTRLSLLGGDGGQEYVVGQM